MFKEGTIIEGPFWNESVILEKNAIERQDYIHIIGKTIYSNEHVDSLIPKEEIEKIKVKKLILDFSADGTDVFLALEATRFRYASIFDPFLAMGASKIDPLPFQIEAVYGYILKLPLIRFLIADDPGAGKTIMAGLIIKELKIRGVVKRILIIVPGHLKDQWKRELKEKFQESFYVIDRSVFKNTYGENVWQKESQVITSIDFAKQEDILPSLNSVHWDLVIVDEAHKMSAYVYGGDEFKKIEKTERYRLGEVLSRTSEHLIFLTATPHKGDPENFRLLLDLLVPGFFATKEMIIESLQSKDNPLFIRRMKEDLKDFHGKPLFPNRYAKTIKFSLLDNEKKLYNELSKYVVSQYNKALQSDKRRNLVYAPLILQRRMASSTYALFKSLERRKKKLEELLKESNLTKGEITPINLEEIEDYEEKERWEKEEELETLNISENKEELKEEINTLNTLMKKAQEILKNEEEIKLKQLNKALEEGFKKIREIKGNEKILIFTEFKDTMEYLVEKISSWGYSVNFIHGGMNLEERIKAEVIFKHETQVMVATEAAGEGINLQFCHLMINYDIPWNPNRLEQRIGRIHRYGQQKDVYIYNLIAEDTKEGEVLSKIFDKLEEIREAMGSDKVFDVIGDIFYEKDLYQLILDAVTNARTMDEIIKELDIRVNEEYIKKIKEALGESLATRYIDFTRIKEMAEKAKENRLIPEYVEEFFIRAFEKAGGKLKSRKDGFISIDSIPYEIRRIGEEFDFKTRYGVLSRTYTKVTFDKELAFKNPDAEFISFGHPLLEALIEWTIKNYASSLQKGAVFEDPEGRYSGIIWFFEGEVKDGKGKTAGKTLIAIYDDGKELKSINPAILWDLVPAHSENSIQIESTIKDRAQEYAISLLGEYRQALLKERKRQAEIKKKYGVRSLEYLINKLDEELVKLYERGEKGEKVDIVIKNKEERKRNYEESLKRLKKDIEHEIALYQSMPKFLGAIYVKPKVSTEMVSDEEIDKIAIRIAMEYERSQGREPEDVSSKNLGFDIKSKGKEEIRYIEVKARKDEGDVALTKNEWFRAKMLKEEYWLYIVANAVTNPNLYIINNPAEELKVEKKVEVVRYIIPLNEWKNKNESIIKGDKLL